MTQDQSSSPVAILAGGGRLPFDLAANLRKLKRQPIVFAIDGEADQSLAEFDPYWVGWGQVGRCLDLAKKHECQQVVMIGSITQRPDYRSVLGDMGTLKRLPRILKAYVGSDNDILTSTINLIEVEGFKVVGAHELAPDLLCPQGTLGRTKPNKAALADAAMGMRAIARLGEFDIGQSVVVIGGRIAAVEAAEGTDAMVSRVAQLRKSGRLRGNTHKGVLVKAVKPEQDLRVDLPAVGPDTVQNAADAGLAGICIEAGRVLMADRAAMIERANQLGLFLHGIAQSAIPPDDKASQ